MSAAPPPEVEQGRRRGFLFRWGRKKAPLPNQQTNQRTPVKNGKAMEDPDRTPLVHNTKKAQIYTSPSSPTSIRSSGSKSSTPVSWLARTPAFRRMCDNAFHAIDTDGSGTVDEKELYSGLLLIHLKLGTYAGPAACRPLAREKCHAIFEKMDVDESGSLDQEEFREVMMVLFSNVLLRVTVQWSMTLVIVPLVAQKLLDYIYAAVVWIYEFVTTMDEYSTWADKIELSIEDAGAFLLSLTPSAILRFSSKVGDLLASIPESVWNTVPLTLISTILGILVVPWVIFKVDDFFQYLASRKAKEKTKQKIQ